jgi:hypothetical protein
MNVYNVTTMPNGLQATGCHPRDTELGAEHLVFENVFETYPRSEWPDLIKQNRSLRKRVKRIKNQKQEGSCASNMTAQAAEIVWNQQYGAGRWVEFSPISIYKWVADGPNSGSTISGNLKQLKEIGLLPVRNERNRQILIDMDLNPEHMLEPTGYYQKFPDDWKETAEWFSGVEAFDIGSFDGIVTALLDGWPVGYGRAGHAICAVSPWYDGRQFGLDYANSWAPSWGDEGFGKDTEDFVSRAIASYGAWGVRVMRQSDRALKISWASAA